MSGLLPTDAEEDRDPPDDARDLRVLRLDDADAEQLFGSLSSDTARRIFSELQASPATASELAESVDTSLQNVRHHLENLREAGLIYVSGTRYSVKGREMDVYEPTDDAVVVCVGDESTVDSLREYVGALALLAAGSVFVQWAFGTAVTGIGGAPETAPRIGDSVDAAEPLLGLLPPGVAFFTGGLIVLLALFAWRNRDALT